MGAKPLLAPKFRAHILILQLQVTDFDAGLPATAQRRRCTAEHGHVSAREVDQREGYTCTGSCQI